VETEVVLRDGRSARIRPILPTDIDNLHALHTRLSLNTIRLRFFTPLRTLSPAFAKHLCEVDFDRRCAFVLSWAGDDAIHAVGRYEWEAPHSAEVAFVVEDALQGLGIGTLLLERLIEHAQGQGFERLTAVVLCENDSMLTIFREAHQAPQITMQGSLAFVKMELSPPPKPRGL
jgi:ribosomal protein S18 acetylase RimI-like enzyme